MPFIVMVRTATGPRSRNGGDRYAAVVELDPDWIVEHPGQEPKMISNRAKGVCRVVSHTGPLHVGKTEKSAFPRGLREMQTLRDHLNRLERHRDGSEPVRTEEIAAEPNAEFRRALIEAMGGIAAYMRAAKAKVIHKDETGQLLRVGDGERVVTAVRVKDATHPRRVYVLRVPPTVTTAREAVAWTFGMTADEYRPTVES